MNIIVSGWPGVGQSTLAIILAKTLGFTLLQGSSTFRYLGQQINFENTGEDRVKADELLEPHWGPIFEKYMQWIADNKSQIVTETDISGFFTKDNPNVYSVFLQAPQEVRISRLVKDGRQKDVDYIGKRDASLTKTYKELFDVDFFDKAKIEDSYTRVLDNSNLTIAEELEIVYSDLADLNVLNQEQYNLLTSQVKQEEEFFWKNGKQAYIDTIKQNGRYPDPATIIKEIKETFPEDIAKLPEDLKNLVLR